MPILIALPVLILLIALIIFISIKVLKYLISFVNKKEIRNSELDKTKIKDL